MDILDDKQWLARLRERRRPNAPPYRAMYSTWWNGIVTDPALMIVPVDDHQVHRGDAVFEAMKAVNGRVWLQREHLDRMESSAASIGLQCPLSRGELESVIAETLKASALSGGIIRLFLSRGPGSFSPNPYDTVGAQVHVVVTAFKAQSAEVVENGVSLGLSRVPAKEPWLARIKSCNYLQNVLMKKDAVDRGFDFTVSVGADGWLTEGSTENILIVDTDGKLVRPKPEGILAGTTMMRAFELAKNAASLVSGFEERDFSVRDLSQAREVMTAGTTLDVTAVTKFEGRPVGDGKPGPVARKLRDLLIADQGS